MAHEIIKRTIGGIDDKRAIVDNLHPPLARKMIFGSDWTKLRVMMLISSPIESNLSSSPIWYFGLCAGVSSPPGSVLVNHFVGIKNPAKINYSASNGVYMSGTGGPTTSVIVNGAETTVAGGSSKPLYAGRVSVGRHAVALEITKGTPNWTIQSFGVAGGTSNITDTSFADLLNTPDLIDSSLMSTSARSDASMAVNEANGYLDSVCFAWLSSVYPFEVSAIVPVRLA